MRSHLALLTLALSANLVSSSAHAQWKPDGLPICTTVGGQGATTSAPDGAGGAIITWYDSRSGTGFDIYAQRVSALGIPQWTADGVAICTVINNQFDPVIVSDGAGGAIISWYDPRSTSYDIYAQRVNASGVPQWAPNGVSLCAAAQDQIYARIASDGAAGAIVTWQDFRSTSQYDVYAQRVNASGTTQWTLDGVGVSVVANDQSHPTLVSDNAGGAIFVWEDSRSGNFDVYAQRVSAAGAISPGWAVNGVVLCNAANWQSAPVIASDGANGAIVAWSDLRSGSNFDIYAQRVSAAGIPLWSANGITVCTSANDQYNPSIVADGLLGAIVTWQDSRSGSNFDIYAQRVTSPGAEQWTDNGVPLCDAANDQSFPETVSDGAGGAIVSWQDMRSGQFDIYAQRVSPLGAPQWGSSGNLLSGATGDQIEPTMVADGTAGAIVTWQDNRSGGADVYTQRVEGRYGYWGRPEPTLATVADVPGDQGGKVILSWYASGRDELNQQVISHYSIWRATSPTATAGAEVLGLSEIGRGFSGSAVREERTPTADYFWELIATQDAVYFPSYAYSAATNFDSTASDPAVHQFQVVAHAYYNQFVNWSSNVVSGYSVDNLAPAAPLMLAAHRVGPNVNLRWSGAVAPDLRDYAIYRATSTGVTPVPLNFLASSEDTVAVDASAPTTALYYIVTALDVHANQSPPSNEASVGATTNVGNTPPITALTILDNMPNPFAGTTTLRVGLPKASEVEIEVFDVAGRSVRSERTSLLAAGWREISFEARDAAGISLPSGVYFYRVRANGETLTRKMVIAR